MLSNIYDSITENGSLILVLRDKVQVAVAILSVWVNHDGARGQVLAIQAGGDGDGHSVPFVGR